MSDVKTGRLIPYLSEMFRLQAWLSMGKVANPMSGEVERDLRIARDMIDLLGELESRTEGHRSEDETRLLRGVLTELRLNYMEEMKKPESSGEGGETASGNADPKPAEDAE